VSAGSWARRPSDEAIVAVVADARRAGLIGPDDTSVLFHDLDLLEARLDDLAAAFPASTLHAIAMKANPLVEVLRVVVERGCGLEAASFEEVALAVAAGCPPERIVFDSPAKTTQELRASLEMGIRVNADNFVELDRIIELRPAHSRSVVGLRVNPMVGAGSIPMTSVAGRGSRFGVPVDEVVAELVPRARTHPWIRCLHHHVGSQGITVDAHAQAAAVMSDLRHRLHEELGRAQFDTIDLGGGATTDYVGEGATDPRVLADALRAAAPDLFADDVTLITEFGRAVHANCGWAVSDVEYVKEGPDGPVAVLHLGADFLLRPVYQAEHWRHRFSVLGTAPVDGPGSWTLSGPLCFAGDIVARDVPLGRVAAGDTVVIHDVGAYTLAMWSRHCSRGIPKVLGHRRHDDETSFTLLRAREGADDVVRFWSAHPFDG
jgi:diaminopimelate decarboxylase